MVSLRCKANVREILKNLEIPAVIKKLGIVELKKELSSADHGVLRNSLKRHGLVLLDKDHEDLIEKVKLILDQMMAKDEVFTKSSYQEFLTENLGLSFSSLSTIFAEVSGCTMTHYIMELRIEKAKEMILYDSLTLKEVAKQLNFRNTVQLNRHFKKVTGLNPSFFQSIKKKRLSLLVKVV